MLVRKRKQLEGLLQELDDFESPRIELEQYITNAELASYALWEIADEVEGKTVVDLGCGTGMLGIGCALMGAAHVTGLELDEAAMAIAEQNVAAMELEDTVELQPFDVLEYMLGESTEERVAQSSGGGGGNNGGKAKGGRKKQQQSARGRGSKGGGRGRKVGANLAPVEPLDADALRSLHVPDKYAQLHADVVITNPPFGTRMQGLDMLFLQCAFKIADGFVYSLHKTSTRDHVAKMAESWGATGKVLAQLAYILPASYAFHRKDNVTIDVDFWVFNLSGWNAQTASNTASSSSSSSTNSSVSPTQAASTQDLLDLTQLCATLAGGDAESSQEAGKQLLDAALGDSQKLQTLVELALGSDIANDATVEFRILQLFARVVAKGSEKQVDLVRESGVMDTLRNELRNDDLLVQLNALQIVQEMAPTEAGASFLQHLGVVDAVWTMLDRIDDHLFASLVHGDLVTCVAALYAGNDETTTNSFAPMLVAKVRQGLEDEMLRGRLVDALNAVAYVGVRRSACERLMDSQHDKDTDIMALVLQLVAQPPSQDIRVSALNALTCCLMHVLDDSEQWVTRNSSSRLSDPWMDYLDIPLPELRWGVLQAMFALSQHEFGTHLLLDTPGLLHFLLDRKTDTDTKILNVKYDIVSHMAQHRKGIDAKQLEEILVFLRLGPLFTEHEVGVMVETENL